jgi:hypothetical protein
MAEKTRDAANCGDAWVAEIAPCPRCGQDAGAHAVANARSRAEIDREARRWR